MCKGMDLTIDEKQKITVIEHENVHFGDIKEALKKSSNDKEGWELKAQEMTLRTCFLKMNVK